MEKTFKSPSNDNNKDINFFGGPIPGQSLTESPGKYPWDKPPKYSDIDDAYEYVSLQIYSEEGIRKIMDLLEMGVSPRLIARSTVLVGWMNNLWNPDVAELLKQAIAVARAVAVKTPPKSNPPSARMTGFKNIMYAMVRKVDTPAITSVSKLVLCFL